jgi:hypothetical protein
MLTKTLDVGGDAAATIVVLGTVLGWFQAAAVLLGVGWFVLRFINFARVNFYNKKPWWMG